MFGNSFYNWLIAGLVLMLVTAIASADINDKVAQLDIDNATLEDVIRVFGEPLEYRWGKRVLDPNNLPATYVVIYSEEMGIFMSGNMVNELRFEGPQSGYVFAGKLKVGSTLEIVLDVLGEPKKIVEGEPIGFEDGVLYKDVEGRKGHGYYARKDKNVRLFLWDNKVAALYVTASHFDAGGGGSRKVQSIKSVDQFADVRWKDLRQIDLSDKPDLPRTFWFNQATVWPGAENMPPRFDPKQLMQEATNPGLGVRGLHKQGITGKGVNVGIIDQPLYLDHPEFAGKIVGYHDVGCGSESSMHGPAVASLLVGTNCGTAPGARVYYVAAPSWTRDTAYQAQGLDWIIEQNKQLSASEKIRVVSVSAAPSGPGSPFEKNQQMWDQACARAEAAGILVLDCTRHHGFIGPCWYDASDPENVAKCTPGFPGRGQHRSSPDRILVPTCPRTTAEEYDKGEFSYQYCGRGGLSWAIPYCAGVLALGWQVNSDLSFEQMRELLFKSAYTNKTGVKIINPSKFIRLVKNAKVAQ